MNPGYYAIIPASVRYDNRLKPNAKLLYGEITCLTHRDGFCWADNSYFAELYHVDCKTISRWISQLESFDYIGVELLKSEGNKRKIIIDKKVYNLVTKKSLPSDKKVTTLVTKKSLPSDKIVTSYKENIKINNKENIEETALNFYKSNFPSAYESFLMQYKSQISDYNHFEKVAALKFEEEQIKYEQRVIKARLERFAINYIANQSKTGYNQPIINNQPEPAYRDKRF